MNGLFVLDTHVLLWSLLKPDHLSDNIRKHIALAQEDNQLLISSISLWEIAMLNFKKRISIYEPIRNFLASIANINGLAIKDITPDIAAESILLPNDFHGDPADRLIVATTKVYGAGLITRDQEILTWANSGYIKILQA